MDLITTIDLDLQMAAEQQLENSSTKRGTVIAMDPNNGEIFAMASHPAYDKWVQQLFAGFNEDDFSSSEQIAEVVFEAATDGRDKLRYVAGEDAKGLYAQRLQLGDEAFRTQIEHAFLGSQIN